MNKTGTAKRLLDDLWSCIEEARRFDSRASIEHIRSRVGDNTWEIFNDVYFKLDLNGTKIEFPSFIVSPNTHKVMILDKAEDMEFKKKVLSLVR